MPGRTRTTNSSGGDASGRKRSRRILEEEASAVNSDADGSDVVQPSSSLQHASSAKRTRLSGSKSTDGQQQQYSTIDTKSQTDDASQEGDAADSPRGTPAGGGSPPVNPGDLQYESMRDMGFEHLRHEEEDDIIATQQLQRRTQRSANFPSDMNGDNRRAENGIIEKVTCVNFMCHARLECELGPLLNFIVGENGSGKSAILTALTLCLGAKASATNRGGSLKNFVKEGEERGFLAVRIKNCGEDAYENDVFGDSIIVERHFSKTGTTSFKLKSAAERVISTKRADVDDVVEYYYLQVDNPLNVLSQDNARQFLNSASASLKYKFFIQGVQLEQLDKDYQLAKHILDLHYARIPQLEEQVKHAKEKFEDAQKLHKIIQDNEDMRRKKRLYMNQLAWSQVVEQERILDACEQGIVEAANNIAEAEQLKEAATQKLEIENERLNRAEEAFASLQGEEDDVKAEVRRATEEHDMAVRELRTLHTDERDIHSHLKLAADRVRDLEDKISEEQQRLENANGEVHRQTQNKLAAAKRRLEEINRDTTNETARLPQLEQEHAAAQSEARRLTSVVMRERENVKAREDGIRSLEGSRGLSSQFDAYGPRMSELVSSIERDGRFAQKPVGPLGSTIRVQKPVWAPILDKTFGNSLNGFIVTSQRDQQVLSGLIKRLNINNVPIFIGNARAISTDGKEPDQQFDTILRILEIDNPLVRNQLIINNYIEQVILVEDRKKAQQVMFSGPAPRNVAACLTLHDRKHGEGLRLTSRGNGNVSTSPVIPNLSQKPRIKTDVDSQIAVQTNFLAHHREELMALRSQLDSLRREEQRCANALKSHAQRMEALRKAARSTNATIREIDEELDKFDGADGRLQALQEELERSKSEKDQFGDQYGDVNIKKAEQNKTVEDLKGKLNGAKDKQKDFRSKLDKYARNIDKLRDLRRVALVGKNEAFEAAEELEERKAAAERKRDRQAQQVEEFIEQARLVSRQRVEIPDGETHDGVEKKLEALVKQLEIRRKRVGMTDEEASNRVVETKAKYEKMKAICDVSKDHVEAIKQALVTRLRKWREFQRYISANSRTNFIYLLSERGYRGKLLIDHENKKLQVHVEPDETRRTVSIRDTKTLSGGEKSFSSICLLLAIWEAMASRLRCLDEFDVFMDNVNRDVSTNMLVDAARRSVGRQYIFITPNAIQGNARHAPDVKIIRLTDPRQRTLDAEH